DPTMEGIEGAGNVPAYRGIAYIVFKDMPLEDFGNRMPQITAEIIKPLAEPDEDSVEQLIQGVNLIPSTGEVAYGTTPTVRDDGFGNAVPENVNLAATMTNIEASIDALTKQLPNNQGVQLAISWFGDDLRAGECTIRPKVEVVSGRVLLPFDWNVGGLTRSQATAVSTDDQGRPIYGGTPSDRTVVESIQLLADTHDQDVYFYPFILMDIEPGNTLPDPETGDPGQPVYPWRGRITASFGVDKTSAAQDEVDNLFGTVSASDFDVSGTTVTYTGDPGDFGYRRMILHYAHLCAAAAQTLDSPSRMKAFYIGSELRGITSIRSTASGTATASTVYPGVNALVTLLEDVRGIFDAAGLTGVQLSYAADWSEYHSHRPPDGSGDVYFNMDAIWGHPDCDYVAIDNYFPLSDWREGTLHEDYGTGTVDAYNITSGPFQTQGFPQSTSIYDEDYLRGQIEGGEGYHYFYASDQDREDQVRTQIFDGANNEHWVFRQKDMRNWWAEPHRSRPGGVRDGSVVALSDGASGSVDTWTPSSKKMVFSEYGCPAVDKGTNQPNVFFDPKSSESFLPYFSRGDRDDFIQRKYYEAIVPYWREEAPTVGGVKLVDPQDMFAWTWDVRPYPAFPFRPDIWADAANYRLGHWLNGRVGIITLGQLVREICAFGGLGEELIDVSGLVNNNALVRGYVIDNVMSPREMLNPISAAYLFDGFESEGLVRFNLRSNLVSQALSIEDLVSDDQDPGGYSLTRAQETELPGAARIAFMDEENDYQPGAAGGVRLVGSSRHVVELRFPIVLAQDYARLLGEVMMQEAWTARERGEFRLPPSKLALDPSDGLDVTINGREMHLRATRIERGDKLVVTTEGVDPSIYETLVFDGRASTGGNIPVFGRTILHIMDLPLVTGDEPWPWAPRIAAYQSPFPAAVNVFRRDDDDSLTLYGQLLRASLVGELTEDLSAADPWLFDNVNTTDVKLYDPSGQLLGVSAQDVLNGANAAAVLTPAGTWEVLQFRDADLVGSEGGLPLYRLGGFLRGQLGTETEIVDPLPEGTPIVFLELEGVGVLQVPNGQKFFTIDYRYGPSNLSPTSPFYQDVTHTGQATGLLPYAPVQLAKLPTGGGSTEVTFTWIRRTRFDGDDFDAENVPLNEETEAYDLEIYDPSGPALLRTVANNPTASYTYTETQQTEDGGALDQYLIRVWQKSAEVGRGRMAEALL
ncbi:hypothetical protein ELZ22_17090, partial [Brucella abortus]